MLEPAGWVPTTNLGIWWADISTNPSLNKHYVGDDERAYLKHGHLVTVKTHNDDEDWVGTVAAFKVWTSEQSTDKPRGVSPFTMIKVTWLQARNPAMVPAHPERLPQRVPSDWWVSWNAPNNDSGDLTSIVIDCMITSAPRFRTSDNVNYQIRGIGKDLRAIAQEPDPPAVASAKNIKAAKASKGKRGGAFEKAKSAKKAQTGVKGRKSGTLTGRKAARKIASGAGR